MKITGVGPVTPAGIGREAFWKGILEPVSRVREYTALGEEHGPFVATFLEDFDPNDHLPKNLARGVARHGQLAMVGTMLALEDAGIELDEVRAQTSAVLIGASLVDFGAICRSIDAMYLRGIKRAMHPLVYTVSPASIGGAIVDRLLLNARSMAMQSSCCAATDSIGQAVEMVAQGSVDIAITGGTEAPLHRHPMLEMRAAGLTPRNSETPSDQGRPFDLWRTTGVIGEGATVLILEPEESPRPALAWIDGYAAHSDYHDAPLSGLKLAAGEAITNAGLRTDEIESINAWGPGHREIDRYEAEAMTKVFGKSLTTVPAYSIKGAIGNPLGAAGAIQAGVATLSLVDGCLPPTVNWKYPDPACPFALSAEKREVPVQNCLVNSHGLAGGNAALVLTRGDRT